MYINIVLKLVGRCVDMLGMNPENFTPEDEAVLRDSLKRCSADTIEKAVEFRKTGNADLVGDVVIGIIARFVEPEKRELLVNPPDTLVILDDLEIDSLTMVEIVLAVEETINTTIGEDEVQQIRTLGDLKNFIKEKVSK